MSVIFWLIEMHTRYAQFLLHIDMLIFLFSLFFHFAEQLYNNHSTLTTRSLPKSLHTMAAALTSSVSNVAGSTTIKKAHNFEITCPLPLTKINSKNLNLPSAITPINRRRLVSIETHEVRNNNMIVRYLSILMSFN